MRGTIGYFSFRFMGMGHCSFSFELSVMLVSAAEIIAFEPALISEQEESLL